MKKSVGLFGGIIFFLSLFVNTAGAAVCDSGSITTKWELVICGGALNERKVERTASHGIGVSGDCGGEEITGGGEENNEEETNYGSGGGPQSSGEQGFGGTATLIDEEGCFFPVCSGASCEEDTQECTGSSVIATIGAYQTGETDLSVPSRSIPAEWFRSYRSNTIVPKGSNFRNFTATPMLYGEIREVPLYFGYRENPYASSFTLERAQPAPPPEIPPDSIDESIKAPAFDLPKDGPLGYGWQSPYHVHLEGITDRELYYVDDRGRYVRFSRDASGNFKTDEEIGLTLLQTQNGFEIWERGGFIRSFGPSGHLLAIWDRFGHRQTLIYNEQSRLTSVKDDRGRTVLTFHYFDDDHRIDQVVDAAGRTVSYEYDDFGNLARVVDPAGKETAYTYNAYHGMTSKTNPVGETYTIEYKYPDRGVAAKVIDPIGAARVREGRSAAGHERTFLYDFQGKNFRIIEPDGTELHRIVNARGKLLAEYDVDLNAKIKEIEYLPNRVEKHTDAAGNVKTIQKDEWGNVIKVIDGEGNETRITYNDQNNPLTITDPFGVITKFEYDASGTLLLKKLEAAGTSDEVITTYVPTEYGEIASITVDGATTTFAYNDQGQLISVTDPLGNASRTEYDAEGNLVAVIDALGNRTTFTYDELGNPVTAEDPLGNVTAMAYDAAGRLKSVTDALDQQTKFETDFKERITAIVDALGHRKSFDYDGSGNLVQVTDGDAVTSMTYDGSGRLTSVTDPEGNTTTYEYAAAGCSSCGGSTAIPESVTDPFGNATRNIFDKNGEIAAIEDPLANLTGLTRDALGRIIGQTDGNGNTVNFEYDPLGRLIKQIDAARGVTAFTYDKRGNLLSLSDPEGNVTTFEYDLAGRKTKEIRPMGETTTYTYYANGLLETVTDPKGQTTTYTYDAASRLTAVTYDDGKQDAFAYDAVGNMTSWTGADGVSGVLTFDELGRKLTETVNYGGFSKTIAYTYDARGNKATYTSPEGIEHVYDYDKNGRPTSLVFDGKTVSLSYEKTRLKQVDFPNGVTTDYSYNANNWLTGISTAGPQGTVLTRDYGFDNVGNIQTKNTEHGNHSYGYDDTYQLTSADNPTLPDEAFTYDAVGNRLTSLDVTGSWSYNGNNELIGNSAATYEYDANGNTVKKIEGGHVTTYVYNARNRLEKVYLPDGRMASYAYDPFGRRVRKQVGNEVMYFAYADEGLVGEYDVSGSLEKSYGWYPDGLWGMNPIYMLDEGSFYFYHADHLGTSQRMTDVSGKVVWSAGFTAFGLALIDPVSTVENNFRFPGQYFDVETGLYYNFQRFYDPDIGHYTQLDPIGFAGGSLNLYQYVQNSPIIHFDYSGLDSYSDNVTRATSIGDIAISYYKLPTTPAQAAFFTVGILADKSNIGLSFTEDSNGKALTGFGLSFVGTVAAVGGGSIVGAGLSGFGLGTSINGLPVYGTNQTTQDWWSEAIWDFRNGETEARREALYQREMQFWREMRVINQQLEDLKEINDMLEYYNERMGGSLRKSVQDCE